MQYSVATFKKERKRGDYGCQLCSMFFFYPYSIFTLFKGSSRIKMNTW